MTQKVRREVDRFACEDDEGNEYEVVEFQHYSIHQPLSGPRVERPTLKEYFLSDGRDANWKDDNTFEIVANDRVIRRV